MQAPPSKHPYANLYTLSEQRMLAWPEQKLPTVLPSEITSYAIRGESLNGFFAGKEVWFWQKAGIEPLLSFLEKHNEAASREQSVWIVYFDVYFDHDGLHDFSMNLNMGYSAPGHWNGSTLREIYVDELDPAYETAVYWLFFEVGAPAEYVPRVPSCIGALAEILLGLPRR